MASHVERMKSAMEMESTIKMGLLWNALSRKPRPISRQARRRSKSLIETHLIHRYHFKVVVTCQFKMSSKDKISHFYILEPQVGWTDRKESTLAQGACNMSMEGDA